MRVWELCSAGEHAPSHRKMQGDYFTNSFHANEVLQLQTEAIFMYTLTRYRFMKDVTLSQVTCKQVILLFADILQDGLVQ